MRLGQRVWNRRALITKEILRLVLEDLQAKIRGRGTRKGNADAAIGNRIAPEQRCKVLLADKDAVGAKLVGPETHRPRLGWTGCLADEYVANFVVGDRRLRRRGRRQQRRHAGDENWQLAQVHDRRSQ